MNSSNKTGTAVLKFESFCSSCFSLLIFFYNLDGVTGTLGTGNAHITNMRRKTYPYNRWQTLKENAQNGMIHLEKLES